MNENLKSHLKPFDYMTSSETLLLAAINRIKARMGNSLLKSISKTKVLIEEGPDEIQKQWNIFKEEIISEASRIEQEKSKEGQWQDVSSDKRVSSDSQIKIDIMREKVAKLTKQVEALN